MSFHEVSEIGRVRERLRLIEQQFEREMRERGFDPSQVDTVPLTTSLAKLQSEQEQLRSRLAALTGEQEDYDRT
jgi:hypothetical protein